MELYKVQNGNCFYCGERMEPARSNDPSHKGWSVDHFVPKCKGGKSLNKNTVLCHPLCNMRKGGRRPTEAEIIKFRGLQDRVESFRALKTKIERDVKRGCHDAERERGQ